MGKARKLAELKLVKKKPHKVGGSCGTVTPANQAQCYRNHGQTPTKEALEFEKLAKDRKLAKLKVVKKKPHKVGGSCGTVTPANQARCYRNHGQTPTKEALEFEKKARKLAKAKDHKKGGSCHTVSPGYQAQCYRDHGLKPTKIALELE